MLRFVKLGLAVVVAATVGAVIVLAVSNTRASSPRPPPVLHS